MTKNQRSFFFGLMFILMIVPIFKKFIFKGLPFLSYLLSCVFLDCGQFSCQLAQFLLLVSYLILHLISLQRGSLEFVITSLQLLAKSLDVVLVVVKLEQLVLKLHIQL